MTKHENGAWHREVIPPQPKLPMRPPGRKLVEQLLPRWKNGARSPSRHQS
jgi:hypothetical protein